MQEYKELYFIKIRKKKNPHVRGQGTDLPIPLWFDQALVWTLGASLPGVKCTILPPTASQFYFVASVYEHPSYVFLLLQTNNLLNKQVVKCCFVLGTRDTQEKNRKEGR